LSPEAKTTEVAATNAYNPVWSDWTGVGDTVASELMVAGFHLEPNKICGEIC
jgi:hypothetical protein